MTNKRRNEVIYKAFTNIISIVLIIIMFIVLPSATGYIENHYTIACVVDTINKDNITIKDKTGNLWSFYGDGFKAGDRVKVTFYNNTTNNTRYDDEIIKVKKIKNIIKKY